MGKMLRKGIAFVEPLLFVLAFLGQFVMGFVFVTIVLYVFLSR